MAKIPSNRRMPSNPNPVDDYPDFFKIFLPQIHSQRMSIPPGIVGNFDGTPMKVILRTSRGRIWQMMLEMIDRKLYLMQGWERFVADNSLQYGEFMVFAYDGNSLFEVKIFGLDCCKKEGLMPNEKEGPYANVCQAIKVEEPLMDQPHTDKPATKGFHRQNDALPDHYVWVRTLHGISYEVNIPSEVSRHCVITPDTSAIFRSQNGIVQIVRLMRRSDGRVVAGSGWKDSCVSSNIVAGDECEFEVVFDKKRQIKEILVRVRSKMSSTEFSWEATSSS